MPSYRYIALSQDHKELSGVIQAPDEQFARTKLGELNFSIVSLTLAEPSTTSPEVPTTSAAPHRPTFEFEAIDKNSKKVVGTIVAESAAKAFGRLFEEYKLNVLWIVDTTATPEAKQAAKQSGITELQTQYATTSGPNTKKIAEDKDALAQAASLAARQELLGKVDFTTQKVGQFLKDYGADLKIEERDTIQNYINQLIRIKDSTNLEHIRSTCERMLDHLQKQELFLHEEQKSRESAKFKVETKEMLSELKRTGLSKDIDLAKIVSDLSKKAFLKPLGDFIFKFFPPPTPDELRIKEEIQATTHHMWSYAAIALTGKNKMLKHEAIDSLKTLFAERKRLKLELRAAHGATVTQSPETTPRLAWEHATSLFGWFLTFYLVVYIVAFPFTVKNFGMMKLPAGLYFYHSVLTKGVTIFLFMGYCALQMHIFWLRKNKIAPFVLYPLALTSFLLIAINLM